MLEARLKITVACHANTIEKAVNDGLDILKSSIDKLLKKGLSPVMKDKFTQGLKI